MTNQRRTGLKNMYRDDFLRSPAWFARRDRWFRAHSANGTVLCASCGMATIKSKLELHHRDYEGVRIVQGTWQAWEDDDDLVALHPHCHELLHRLIDRDVVLARHRSRRDASDHALGMLQLKLQEAETTS